MHYAEQRGESTTKSTGIHLTNRTTGKSFRPGHKYKHAPGPEGRYLASRFRSDFYAKVGRRISAKKSLALNRRGRRLLRFHKYRLWLYTLNPHELGADDEQARWLEDGRNFDNPALVEAWLRLLDVAFPGQPFRWALHVGRCGRVHAHVVAGQLHNIPNLSRDPRRREQVKDTQFDRVKVLAYLTVKNEPTAEQLTSYRKAANRAGGARRLPRHSGYRGFEAPRRARKALKTPVLDGVGRKFNINNGLVKAFSTMTLDRMERLLFTGSRETISRSWTPNGPPVGGSP